MNEVWIIRKRGWFPRYIRNDNSLTFFKSKAVTFMNSYDDLNIFMTNNFGPFWKAEYIPVIYKMFVEMKEPTKVEAVWIVQKRTFLFFRKWVASGTYGTFSWRRKDALTFDSLMNCYNYCRNHWPLSFHSLKAIKVDKRTLKPLK